ncbi:putative ABC transporter ATP-binding protein [compost metagenome]
MEKLRVKLHALDAIIADADLYSDARRAERQKVMAEHGEHGKRMDELEEQWLEIQGSLEEIDQSEA